MRQPTRPHSSAPAGFTLLQLIVVIAIIGLVSTIATVASWRAVVRTREARRVHDLREIQEALGLYWIDKRSYPYTDTAWYTSCDHDNGNTTPDDNMDDYIPGLVPKYIARLPVDSIPCPTHYGYYYRSNGTDYKFDIHSEYLTQPIGQLLRTFNDPALDFGSDCKVIDGPNTEHFTIYTPDAVCWTGA